MFANFTSPKGRIALQGARKIASCDRAFNFNSNFNVNSNGFYGF